SIRAASSLILLWSSSSGMRTFSRSSPMSAASTCGSLRDGSDGEYQGAISPDGGQTPWQVNRLLSAPGYDEPLHGVHVGGRQRPGRRPGGDGRAAEDPSPYGSWKRFQSLHRQGDSSRNIA